MMYRRLRIHDWSIALAGAAFIAIPLWMEIEWSWQLFGVLLIATVVWSKLAN